MQKSTNFIIIVFILIIAVAFTAGISPNQNKWTAPKSADNFKNPISRNDATIADGKKIFTNLCVVCHGNKGKGDGIAGMVLNPRPANFTSSFIQSQSDGAIYWKITTGKAPMASYEKTLSETQRWYLVNYIRNF